MATLDVLTARTAATATILNFVDIPHSTKIRNGGHRRY